MWSVQAPLVRLTSEPQRAMPQAWRAQNCRLDMITSLSLLQEGERTFTTSPEARTPLSLPRHPLERSLPISLAGCVYARMRPSHTPTPKAPGDRRETSQRASARGLAVQTKAWSFVRMSAAERRTGSRHPMGIRDGVVGSFGIQPSTHHGTCSASESAEHRTSAKLTF